MKPVFATNVTENKKNDVSNAEAFVCQRISQMNKESLDRVSEENNKVIKKASLPLPLRIMQIASMIVGFICFRVTMNLTRDGMSSGELLREAPVLFVVLAACVVVFGVVTFWGNAKSKKIRNSEESEIAASRADVVCRNIYAELGVTEQTPEVDIFDFKYKEKKNDISFVAFNKMSAANFMNFPYKFYVNEGNLYLADLEVKYCIPLNKVKGIKTVKKQATIPMFMWNKEIAFNEGYYKQFKIRSNDGNIFIKPYHILCFEHNGEDWGLYFPCYELPLFEQITGFKAE